MPTLQSLAHEPQPSSGPGFRLGLIGIAFYLLALASAFGQQEPVAETTPEQVIRDLAVTDVDRAVEQLRHSSIPPEALYNVFSDLDTDTHLRLLHAITSDDRLANRFVFDSLILAPSVAALDDKGKAKTNGTVRQALVESRARSIQSLIEAAPADFPAILLLPSFARELYVTTLGYAFLLASETYAGESQPLPPALRQPGAPATTVLLLPSLDGVPLENIPPRFHEVLELAANLVWLQVDGFELRSKPDLARVAELIEQADLPLAVRLGYLTFGRSYSDEFPLPLSVKTASWLAEAWENDMPAGASEAQVILERFFAALSTDEWTPTARRLLAAWPGLPEDAYDHFDLSWMIGIAAQLGDQAAIEGLLTELAATDTPPALSADPVLALLVRAGEHDHALTQLTSRKEQLLQKDRSVSAQLFDPQLESQIPALLAKLTDAEFRILTELHLKVIPDSPRHAPQGDRATRLAEVASRIVPIHLDSPNAALTALRLIGKEPLAAAEIADFYLDFTQFDRVERHLANAFRADDWIALANNTLEALIAAKRYDDAIAIIDRLATATSRQPKDSPHRDRYSETWKMLTDTLTDQLTPASDAPAGMLPLARLASQQPQDSLSTIFHPGGRASLVGASIAAHAEHGLSEAWWTWHQALPAEIRVNHDTCLIRNALGHDHIEPATDSEKPPALKPDTLAHRALIETFETIPHDRPIDERLDALTQAITTDTPRAIKVIHRFRYLTTDEILAHAESLVAALPADSDRHWIDLAYIAEAAGRTDLADQFRHKANAAPPH